MHPREGEDNRFEAAWHLCRVKVALHVLVLLKITAPERCNGSKEISAAIVRRVNKIMEIPYNALWLDGAIATT
jgi:hypothetical protein